MAFGLDLGTTNSSIAWSDPAGDVHSLSVRSRKEPFDAVVRTVVFDPLEQAGPAVVGDAAFEAAAGRAEPFLTSFKLKLDKQRLRQTVFRYEATKTNEYDPVNQTIRFAERQTFVPLYYDEHSREEVVAAAAQVIRRLLTSDEIDHGFSLQASASPRGVLSRFLGRTRTPAPAGVGPAANFEPEPDEQLFVGVPIFFGPTARRRLFDGLARSGSFGAGPASYVDVLRRCRFVYEPLALAASLQLFESQTGLIVDYGGGSLDLALLAIEFDEAGMPPAVRERALGGLPWAGDAIDQAFRESLLTADPDLRRAYETELGSGSSYDKWRAGNYFTLAKIELSREDSTVLRLPGFERTVTRVEFERAVAHRFDEVVTAVHDCLVRGGLQPHEVGHVVLTGGSSLIPGLQARIREVFRHVSDANFVAGRAGDLASEREALTGVSRGLARFGFLQRFETTAPCDFSVWSSAERKFVVCLPRGAPDAHDLKDAPAARVRIDDRRPCSFALYSNLVRDAFCGAVADVAVAPGVPEVEIRVAAARSRFTPAFGVYLPGVSKPLATFDLESLAPEQLADLIGNDWEWYPHGDHLISAFLTKPLQLGDFVEWRANGQFRRGKVIAIRDVNANESVDDTGGFDPNPYVVTVAVENDQREVLFGHLAQCSWTIGDVRLV